MYFYLYSRTRTTNGVHKGTPRMEASIETNAAIDQLTGESGGGASESWTYDGVGNCLSDTGAGVTNTASYDADNTLQVWSTQSVTGNVIRGQVDPGPQSNKWYNTWAAAGGRSVRVNPTNGSFEIPAIPLRAGSNTLAVTVRDVSGNMATQSVSFVKQSSAGNFSFYDANGNLASTVNNGTTVAYSYDYENRLVSVTSNGATIFRCWYDGAGRRIAKSGVIGMLCAAMGIGKGTDAERQTLPHLAALKM